MKPVQTPSPEHAEFDQMVSSVDDFETLPWHTVPVLEESEQPDEQADDVDQVLLAGLVSPV